MNCPSFGELLANLDGSGGDSERRAAERHVKECSACARLLADCEAAKSQIAGALQSLLGARDETCPDIEELEALVSRPASGPSLGREALDRHLLRCDTCREYVDGLSRWAAAPDSAFSTPPAALLHRAVHRPAPRTWWASPRFALPTGAAALAALALLFVFRGVLDVQTRRGVPGTFAPVPETSFPDHQAATPAPISKQPEKPAAAVQPSPGVSANTESAKTRSLSRGVTASTVTLRLNTPSGVEELAFPFSRAPALYSGGEYGLRIGVATAPTWLYVYQVDARNKISALFPNADYHTGSNPIATAREVLLPDGVNWYRLDETTGDETVYVVRTAERCAVCEELLSIASRGDEGPDAAKTLRQLLLSQNATSGGRRSPIVTVRFLHRAGPSR